MKTGETLIKTYTAQELYERYPNAEFLASFDLSEFHHETVAQAHRKKSKQKNQESVDEKQLHKEPKELPLPIKESIVPRQESCDEEKITTRKRPQKNSIEVENPALTREEKKERDSARKRAWRASNREKLLEKNQAPRDLDKEKTILQKAEKTKAYNVAHREERCEKSRAYHAANREKINAHKRAQRALKKAASPTTLL